MAENRETWELKETTRGHLVQSCHNADDKAEGQRGGDNTRAWALPLSADRVLSVEPHHLPDSNCPPSCGVLFQEDGGVETQEL